MVATLPPILLAGHLLLAALLGSMGLFHVYWAFGGSLGINAAIPSHDQGPPLFQPGRWGTLAMALLFFVGVSLVAAHGGHEPPDVIPLWGMRLMGGVFLLRAVGEFNYVGFFRRQRQTTFARYDKLLFTPLSLGLGLLSLVLV